MTQTPLRRTKIVATLGPATDAPGMLEKIIAQGVNVARLNLSHGAPDDHRARANAVREAAAKVGVEVGILADLQGPKIRVEKFANGPVMLEPGDAFTLDCRADAPEGDATRVGVSYLNLPNDVQPGDVLLFDDGLVAMEVVSIDGAQIHCRVTIGGKLSNRKGLNRQGGGLSVDALSDKDRNDIKLADDEKTVTAKVMTMVTDPARIRKDDPGHPEVCMIYNGWETFAPEQAPEIAQLCRAGEIGCVQCKRNLAAKVNERLAPMQARRRELEQDPGMLDDILLAGNARCRAATQETLTKVRDAMHLNQPMQAPART